MKVKEFFSHYLFESGYTINFFKGADTIGNTKYNDVSALTCIMSTKHYEDVKCIVDDLEINKWWLSKNDNSRRVSYIPSPLKLPNEMIGTDFCVINILLEKWPANGQWVFSTTESCFINDVGVGTTVPGSETIAKELHVISDNLIGKDDRNSSGEPSDSFTIPLEKLFPAQEPSVHDNDDIRNLKLSRHAYNCLHKMGIQSIGELREFTAKKLLAIERFGKRALQEVQDELMAYGLSLKEDKND